MLEFFYVKFRRQLKKISKLPSQIKKTDRFEPENGSKNDHVDIISV